MRFAAASSRACSMRITMNMALLRPAKRPGGKEIKAFLRRPLRAIRSNWPRTEILVRGDSPLEVLDFCRANGLDCVLGVAPTPTLRRHIEDLEAATKTLYEATPKDGKARRFKEFYDGAASWSRVERIIARVEVGAQARDTRFVVTNLKRRNTARPYEDEGRSATQFCADYCAANLNRARIARKPKLVVRLHPSGTRRRCR